MVMYSGSAILLMKNYILFSDSVLLYHKRVLTKFSLEIPELF